MVGEYEIEIYNNRVHYYLTVRRNITILQGNSATGKTELIRLIQEYEMNKSSSGITIKSDVQCTVLTSIDWKLRLSRLEDRIVFIDETADFIKSKEFALMVRGSNNYFVIITRDDLSQLPYSVDEIYGLRNPSESSKYKSFKKVYNETYKLYNLKLDSEVSPDVVITEDTNSGFQCFSMLFDGICEAAGGKSKVYGMLREKEGQTILVIVDGAAFGSEMGRIYRYLKYSGKECVIYAPESFEYLILKSGIIDVPFSVTEETFLHADSTKYLSWEEFYMDYLVQNTKDTVFQYKKSELGSAYKSEKFLERINALLPEQIKSSTFL